MKNLWCVMFLAVAMAALIDCAMANTVIISNFNFAPFNDTVNGILQVLPNARSMDVVKNAKEINSLSADSAERVIAIGSEAVEISKHIPSAIPITYTMVLYPWVDSNHSVNGVLMKIGIADQMKMMRKTFPTRKRIAVIYSPNDSSAEDIKEARVLCPQLGFALSPISVEDKNDIPNVVGKFSPADVDIIWVVFSTVTCNFDSMSVQINYALKNKIPLVGLSASHAKAGALIAFAPDYNDIGVQTALMAKNAGGAKSKVENPRKIEMFVNPDTKKQINISDLVLPEDVKLIQY